MQREQIQVGTGNCVEELLTIQELAEKLKTRASWIYARTRQKSPGSIPTVRCGKYLRFRFSDVLAWLENRYGQN